MSDRRDPARPGGTLPEARAPERRSVMHRVELRPQSVAFEAHGGDASLLLGARARIALHVVQSELGIVRRLREATLEEIKHRDRVLVQLA